MTNTWFCRSGPHQLFLFLFVTGTGAGGLYPFYSCFFTVDPEKLILRSQTLFKKVAVTRYFWYIVAAKACFYKARNNFFTSAVTVRFFASLRFCASSYKKWPLTYVCHLKAPDNLIMSALSNLCVYIGVSHFQK